MTDSVTQLKQMLADGEPKEKKNPQKWAGFVEGTVVDFFDDYRLERLSVEDGNGNKAKMSRTKDNSIKIEYCSTVMM